MDGKTPFGHRTICSQWKKVFDILEDEDIYGGPQRTMYKLTPEAIEALIELNGFKQPLIYVLLRFCNCPELRNAIFRSAPEYAFRVTTRDGSTPLVGMMYQQGQSIPHDELRRIASKVGEAVWNMKNHRGESPALIASFYGFVAKF